MAPGDSKASLLQRACNMDVAAASYCGHVVGPCMSCRHVHVMFSRNQTTVFCARINGPERSKELCLRGKSGMVELTGYYQVFSTATDQ